MSEKLKSVEIWVDIEYQSGNKMRKDFTDVHALANFLKDNPEVARRVNYVRKKIQDVN